MTCKILMIIALIIVIVLYYLVKKKAKMNIREAIIQNPEKEHEWDVTEMDFKTAANIRIQFIKFGQQNAIKNVMVENLIQCFEDEYNEKGFNREIVKTKIRKVLSSDKEKRLLNLRKSIGRIMRMEHIKAKMSETQNMYGEEMLIKLMIDKMEKVLPRLCYCGKVYLPKLEKDTIMKTCDKCQVSTHSCSFMKNRVLDNKERQNCGIIWLCNKCHIGYKNIENDMLDYILDTKETYETYYVDENRLTSQPDASHSNNPSPDSSLISSQSQNPLIISPNEISLSPVPTNNHETNTSLSSLPTSLPFSYSYTSNPKHLSPPPPPPTLPIPNPPLPLPTPPLLLPLPSTSVPLLPLPPTSAPLFPLPPPNILTLPPPLPPNPSAPAPLIPTPPQTLYPNILALSHSPPQNIASPSPSPSTSLSPLPSPSPPAVLPTSSSTSTTAIPSVSTPVSSHLPPTISPLTPLHDITHQHSSPISTEAATEDTPQLGQKMICKSLLRNGFCNNSMRCKNSYLHPKLCQNALDYGTLHQKGCTFGKHCKDQHPFMCRNYMRNGYCRYGKRCLRYHPRKINNEWEEQQQHQQRWKSYENNSYWKDPDLELQETMNRMMILLNKRNIRNENNSYRRNYPRRNDWYNYHNNYDFLDTAYY